MHYFIKRRAFASMSHGVEFCIIEYKEKKSL